MPQSVWTLPAQPGTEAITPDDVYYRGERDADFGELLRRVAHRKGLASPRGAATTWSLGFQGLRPEVVSAWVLYETQMHPTCT